MGTRLRCRLNVEMENTISLVITDVLDCILYGLGLVCFVLDLIITIVRKLLSLSIQLLGYSSIPY